VFGDELNRGSFALLSDDDMYAKDDFFVHEDVGLGLGHSSSCATTLRFGYLNLTFLDRPMLLTQEKL
jgi:hypothetical protein